MAEVAFTCNYLFSPNAFIDFFVQPTIVRVLIVKKRNEEIKSKPFREVYAQDLQMHEIVFKHLLLSTSITWWL